MRIFLDSGNIEEIQKGIDFFNIEGITTNPKLASISVAKQIMRKFRIPTSVQPDVRDFDKFFENVNDLADDQSFIAKVPVNYPKIIKTLVSRSIPVNCTLCFSLSQIITCVNLHADYVSIFLGRILENGLDGEKLIKDSVDYIQNCGSRTQIIVASIRNLEHLEMSARCGAHIVTVSPKILFEALNHPMTEAGEQDFWKR